MSFLGPFYLHIFCLLLSTQVFAQDLISGKRPQLDIKPNDVIVWDAVQGVKQAGGEILLGLRLTTYQGFAIYKSRLKFESSEGLPIEIISSPESRTQDDPMGEGQVEVYDGGDFEIRLLAPRDYVQTHTEVGVTFLGCTQQICLFPYTQILKVPVFTESSEKILATSVQPTKQSAQTLAESDSASLEVAGLSQEEAFAERLKKGELPWMLTLLVIFLGGIATNLTPCVFPMIPITLRLLANQGQARAKTTIFYALGIVGSYTGLGLLASLTGGIFGSVLANPWVNVGFGIIFIILAVTMLGFGDLSRLQTLGSRIGAGTSSSTLRALGMGIGSGLVAAPCTGPIMAALLAYAATLQERWQAVGLFLLYSLGFALPYVFLGFAAQRVVSYKIRPTIQVGIKILFAASMFGLAFFYLKNPLYNFTAQLQGSWRLLFLSLTIPSLAILVFMLLNSKWIHRKGVQLIPTFVLGIGLFAGSQWLNGGDVITQLNWLKDEEIAYTQSQQTAKPILVDGWAEWCIACKKMDQSTLVDPEIVKELEAGWILLKLDMTEQTEQDEALAAKYKMHGLPTYVLVPADGDLSKSVKLEGFIGRERMLAALKAFRGN